MNQPEMSSHVPFDHIVKAEAEKKSFQFDWDRQRASAKMISSQFAQGFDTVLLADEVGMGKTYVALSVMAEHIMQSPKNDRKVLLVTPPSSVLRDKWEQEILSFDAKYVCSDQGRKHLRPLQVDGYWELLRNLHDYADQENIQRVHEADRMCFLYCFFRWASKRAKPASRTVRWPDVRDFSEESTSYFHFCSRYSEQAISSYLDEVNASRSLELSNLILELRAANCPPWRIANLFKAFARQQDRFEANVFIMGMSAVRKPRGDKSENKRLCMFILGQLLNGRRSQTREAFIKSLEAAAIIPAKDVHLWSMYIDQVADLSRIDLYGLKASVNRVLSRPDIGDRWESVSRSLLNSDHRNAPQFFKDVCAAIFQEKLLEANVDLAVVDEVHNWKNGNLGAIDFQKHYAPSIASKLIISATPFQIEEGEMQRLFGFVQNPEKQTAAVINDIFREGGKVTACLQASAAFSTAWKELSENFEDASRFQSLYSSVMADRLPDVISKVKDDPGFSGGVRRFSQAAYEYKAAIIQLETELRKVVVRHTKRRDKRNYHIGADFNDTSSSISRHSLYLAKGYASERDALVNFVGIRLDQLIRRESKQSFETNARLLGGITSSTSAFKESQQRLQNDKKKGDATKAYGMLFEKLLDHHLHPKVAATVDRAFKNFAEGRKTLIFCERVATLGEIRKLLSERINVFLDAQSSNEALKRETLLKNTAFVDNVWWLSLRSACKDQPTWDTIDASHFLEAREFAKGRLLEAGIKATPRRIIRLLDCYMVNQACESGLLKNEGWASIETIYAVLSQRVNQTGEQDNFAHLHAFLNSDGKQSLERIEEQTEEDAGDDIDTVVDQIYRQRRNLWQAEDAAGFHHLLWQLLESEAEQLLALDDHVELKGAAFATIMSDLFEGLRKIVLRHDLIARYDQFSQLSDRTEKMRDGFCNMPVGNETMLMRTMRFLRSLLEENGSINQAARQNSKRKSLWQGVFLQKVECVETLSGDVDQTKRRSLCAAFNSPLLPDVLICTAIGSEGIDLHRHCAEIIHHDLPWNPARLEQRIGRLDRVNSLAENTPDVRIQIGIPFLAHNYEKFQYDVVYSRTQKFEVLMGRPEYAVVNIDEEKFGDQGDSVVMDLEELADASADEVLVTLPDPIIEYLRMDLSVYGRLP